MNIITTLSGWFARLFTKKSQPNPNEQIVQEFEDRIQKAREHTIQDIPYQEYVKKIEFLKQHLNNLPLWVAVVRLYYNQKGNPKDLVKNFGKWDEYEINPKIFEQTKVKLNQKISFFPVKSMYLTEQEKFQNDFRLWLKEEKDTLMKDANTDLFIEFVKERKDLTDEILDHVRVSATWINGVFVNHREWQKEIDEVKTFFRKKSLTSEATNTI